MFMGLDVGISLPPGNALACDLKNMAERPVSEIVKQGGDDGVPGAMRIEFAGGATGPYLALDAFHEPSCAVKGADGMGEAGMSGRGKDKFRRAQLLDAPQSLEVRCLQQIPCGAVGMIIKAKINDAVNCILYALIPPCISFCHDCRE